MWEEEIDESITSYMVKLAELTYENEVRREDSIIRQAGNMQAAFSFCTAVIFVILPIVINLSLIHISEPTRP